LTRITGPIPLLEHSDLSAGILVTTFLPGELVLHSISETNPDIYRQAGEILARIQILQGTSIHYLNERVSRVRELIAEASGLVQSAQLAALKQHLDDFESRPIELYFTHGDYQPRNWLVHESKLYVIDFGRGAPRSWVSDLVRLQNQQFLGHPAFEDAFMEGLDRDPTKGDLEILRLETIIESLGTVVWSHKIGDDEFEDHGRLMIDRFLEAGS
jgi:hypothetical protein